jgi:hypothetical protein
VRLEGDACAGLEEQRLEHVLDPLRRAEQLLDPRAAAAAGDEREVAWARVARALPIDDDRNARREVRLADEQLPASGELDYDRL